jgi:hypothetical protein
MKSMSESIAIIAPSLLAAQKDMGDAKKDSKNPFFKSSYADLNAVREVAIPAFNKYGISVLQPTVTLDGKNYVQTLLLHVSGEYLASLTEIKNTKGDAQSEGSGISYARRYGLQSFANIGAVDDDAESTMKRTEPAKPTVTKSSFNKNTQLQQAINDNAANNSAAQQTTTNGTKAKVTPTSPVSEVEAGDDW